MTLVIEVPEEIHTFNEWKKLGYVVKKGERSIARFPIWRSAQKTEEKDDGEGDKKPNKGKKKFNGQFYQKMSFFFSEGQVEPLKR